MSSGAAELSVGSEPSASPPDPARERVSHSPGSWSLVWSRLCRDRFALVALGFLMLMILVAILAPLVVSVLGLPGPNAIDRHSLDAFAQPTGPSATHPLGVDPLGRDVLSRIIYGARISLLVAFASAALATILGLAVGVLARRLPRWPGRIFSGAIDLGLALPLLVFGAGFAAACSGPGGCVNGAVRPGAPVLIMVIALTTWTFPARVAGLRLPDLGPRLVVRAVSLVPIALLYEAALSFLGTGPRPPTASWGRMIAGALFGFSSQWWYLLFPGLVLSLTLLALNLVARALRDTHPGGAANALVLDDGQPTAGAPRATRAHRLRQVLRRILVAIALLVGATLLVFLLFQVLPSTDRIHQSFSSYLRSVFVDFNLGRSAANGGSVAHLVVSHLPVTAFMFAGAGLLCLAVVVPLGVLCADRVGSRGDGAVRIFSLVLVSTPVFWLGLVVLYLFAGDVGRVHLLPGQGSYTQAQAVSGRAAALILPWVTITATAGALYVRRLRARLLDVLSRYSIQAARAKGLSERTVIVRHALPSVILAGLRRGGVALALVLIATVGLAEITFGVPGDGRLLYTAIQRGDLAVVQGITLLAAFLAIVIKLLLDLACDQLGPRAGDIR